MTTMTSERTDLTSDEVVLLRLLAEGLPTEAVARRLHTSERTVRRRTRELCDRLQMSSTIQVVAWAARRGLI